MISRNIKIGNSNYDILKALGLATLGAGALGISGLVYCSLIEPLHFDVTQIPVKLKGLAEQFDGYRIVQISDLHSDEWLNRERLTQVVEIINAQSPDLVALTGDYVTHGNNPTLWSDLLVDPLRQLQARDGVVAVMGNHDYRSNPHAMREILHASHVEELRNCSKIIERDGKQLAISGVDDVWIKHADLDAVIAGLPKDVPAVLLAHEPDYADVVAESGRFGLQMSGHSHGGQIRIPGFGAPILPVLGQKYSMGRYQIRNLVQYTNRGVGMIPPTMRFGCPPEISVFTLHCA